MFDIGWTELLLVAVLAIIFVGPRDLPRVMRTIGQYTARMRKMAREFQQNFEDLARETELEDLRKEMAELRGQAMAPVAMGVDTAMAKASGHKSVETPALTPEETGKLADLPAPMQEAMAEAHAAAQENRVEPDAAPNDKGSV